MSQYLLDEETIESTLLDAYLDEPDEQVPPGKYRYHYFIEIAGNQPRDINSFLQRIQGEIKFAEERGSSTVQDTQDGVYFFFRKHLK